MAAVGDVGGGASMWALTLGLAVLLATATQSGADPAQSGYGRRGMSPTERCDDPSYLSLDPDVPTSSSFAFTVRVIEPNRLVRFERAYVYPTADCCWRAQRPAADLAAHVKDRRATVVVGDCQ